MNCKLMEWMESKGLLSDLEIVDFPLMGKGLKSKKEFRQGNVFLRIPEELIITIESVASALHMDLDSLTEIQALVLFLAAMKSNILKGDWDQYLNAIPKEFILPMTMDSCVLDYSSWNLKRHVKKQLEVFNKDIQAISSLGLNMSMDAIKWAWLAVNTRCVTLQSRQQGYPTIALMPFLDFLNHSSLVSTVGIYDKITKSFELSCKNRILAQNQVFLCYGPHDNTFLACEYGFVEEDNCYDYVMIEPEMVYMVYLESFPGIFSKEFKEICALSNILQEFSLHLDQVSYSLIMATRLAVYLSDQKNDSDFSDWYDVVYGRKEIVSPENELKANQIIRNIKGICKDWTGYVEQVAQLKMRLYS